MRPNLAFVFNTIFFVTFGLMIQALPSYAQTPAVPTPTPVRPIYASGIKKVAPTPTPAPNSTYEILSKRAFKIEETATMEGWSYIVSGGVAVAISVPAYFMTSDIFAQTVFSLGETLGVASVGYGSYLVLVKDDYTRFQRILAQSSLSAKQRDELSLRFLEENAKRAKAVRKIRVITHSLTAGLNILNGYTTTNSQLKTALYFLGGINLLAAVHFTFTESEEETFYKKLADNNWELVIPPASGPAFAFQLHF